MRTSVHFCSDAPELVPAHPGDAGVDLRSIDSTIIPAGGRDLVRTGLRVAIPEGYVGLVCSRSGIAHRNGLFVLNAPGIVDSGYRGDVGVVLANWDSQPQAVHAGDRVAQLVIVPAGAAFVPTEVLPDSERGVAGFGSTGR